MTLYCVEKVVSGIVTFRQNINNTNKYDSLQIIDHKKPQILEIPTLLFLISVSSTAIQVQINNNFFFNIFSSISKDHPLS